MADIGEVATGRRADDDDVFIKRGPRELFDRRWGAGCVGSCGG